MTQKNRVTLENADVSTTLLPASSALLPSCCAMAKLATAQGVAKTANAAINKGNKKNALDPSSLRSSG